MRAPVIHAGPVWGPRLQTALVLAVAALLAGAAGMEVAEGGDRLTTPLLGLVALAGAVLLFSIPPDKLFLGWLLLAPLLQESAASSVVGHPLALSLYVAPTLVLAVVAGSRVIHTHLRWFDVLPLVYVLFVGGSLVLTTDSFADDPIGTLRSFYVTTLIGLIAYYFLISAPSSLLSAVSVIKVVVAAALLQAAMSIIEWQTGWNLWGESIWRAELTRSVSTLTNPSVLGTVLGLGLVWALAVLLWDGPQRLHLLSAALVATAPLALYVTYTRAPIFAATLVSIPLVLLSPRVRWPAVALLGFTAVAVVLSWGAFESTNVYKQRFGRIETAQTRLYLQEVSLAAARERPAFGWGYGSFDRIKELQTVEGAGATIAVQANTSHNSFLTVLVEFGGLGLALLVLPWLAIGFAALNRARRPEYQRWIFVGGVSTIAVYSLNAYVIDMRFFSLAPALLWLLLGVTRRALAEESRGGRTVHQS